MKAALLFLIIVSLGPVAAPQQQPNAKLQIYDDWNRCVETLKLELDDPGLWFQVKESLLNDPPEHVRNLDRERMLEELIRLHEERLKLLQAMLRKEKRN